jgi:hypothetical protein
MFRRPDAQKPYRMTALRGARHGGVSKTAANSKAGFSQFGAHPFSGR